MNIQKRFKLTLIVLFILMFSASYSLAGLHPSYSPKAKVDTLPFYTAGNYNPNILSPDDHFPFPIGVKAVRYYDLESYIKKIAEQSDRVKLEKHTVTHEGRQLYNLYISTPENIGKLKMALRSLYDDPAIDEITFEELNQYPVIRYGTPDDFYIDMMIRLGEAFNYDDLDTEKVKYQGIEIIYQLRVYESKD